MVGTSVSASSRITREAQIMTSPGQQARPAQGSKQMRTVAFTHQSACPPTHPLAHQPTVLMLSLKVWPSPLTRRLMPSKADRSYSAVGAGELAGMGDSALLTRPVVAWTGSNARPSAGEGVGCMLLSGERVHDAPNRLLVTRCLPARVRAPQKPPPSTIRSPVGRRDRAARTQIKSTPCTQAERQVIHTTRNV